MAPVTEEDITRYKLIAAALFLSTIAVAPVSAQQVIDGPGAFAFYHPNADVLNGGRPTTERQ